MLQMNVTVRWLEEKGGKEEGGGREIGWKVGAFLCI